MKFLAITFYFTFVLINSVHASGCGRTISQETKIYDRNLPSLISIFKAIIDSVLAGTANTNYGINAIVGGVEVMDQAKATARDIQKNPDDTNYRSTINYWALEVSQERISLNEGMKEARNHLMATEYLSREFDRNVFEKQFRSAVKNKNGNY